MQQFVNVPEILLAGIKTRRMRAEIIANEPGILQGSELLAGKAGELGLAVTVHVPSGAPLSTGQKIVSLQGDPMQIVQGEDFLLGLISKASGIATAAAKAVRLAGRIRVVSGGWKKIPRELKDTARAALTAGGAGMRILDQPFLYLDKNYLRIFGSLEEMFKAAAALPDRAVSVQIRGETAPIADEAVEATRLGARIVMVDTGKVADIRVCAARLREVGLRDRTLLAFAGGVRVDDLPGLQKEDLDIVDIGRAILDAPLLDFRYDVIKEQ